VEVPLQSPLPIKQAPHFIWSACVRERSSLSPGCLLFYSTSSCAPLKKPAYIQTEDTILTPQNGPSRPTHWRT
jgi:hypothetical protein